MKPIGFARCVVTACVGLGLLGAAGAVEVGNSRTVAHAPSGLVVIAGEVELPVEGYWRVVEPAGAAAVRQVYLAPPGELMELRQGSRMREVQKERLLRQGRWPLWGIYHACSAHAAKHDHIGPASFADLDAKEYDHILRQIDKGPGGGGGGEGVRGPFYALIPGVSFAPAEAEQFKDRVLAVELHPAVADGQHWAVFADGGSRRIAIDAAGLAKHGIVVEPAPVAELPPAGEGTVRYRIYGLVNPGGGDVAELRLANSKGGEGLTCRWAVKGVPAAPDGDPAAKDWAAARLATWLPYLVDGEAPVLRLWAQVQHRLFGTDGSLPRPGGRRRGRGDEPRTASILGVLGGQAALRETLQMQSLNPDAAAAGEPTVAVASLPGVEVKSHPFEEMLAGQGGGQLALAEHVPVDRFMLYVAKPSAALAFLDEGAAFLARGGAAATGRSFDYSLKRRYMARLGMDEKWVESFLKSGAVTEMAAVLPDLFLIDGAEITVILRIPQLPLARPLLAALRVGELTAERPSEVATPGGGRAWWAASKDVLFVSTSRTELEAVLGASRDNARASLGRSAEFRYMLTRLPVGPETRLYAYFSDPFIRRLVGPAVKIGQLRRLQAKLSLEEASAAALLYRLDGHAEAPTLDRLTAAGYLPAEPRFAGLALAPDGTARSPAYGGILDLASISARPVETATAAEAKAYADYVRDYSRFWRQFFDPIAMRLDDRPGGELELTTFILPLLNSEMYDGLREILPSGREAPPLRIPQVEPAPVMLLSANLPEKAWVKVVDGVSEGLAGFDPGVLDSLGPGVHLAVRDSDPVIAVGSGDVMGALAMAPGGMRGGEMLFIPLALSVLTRPCSLLVETRAPEAVREALRQGSLAMLAQRFGGMDDDVRIDYCQVAGRDAWIYAFDVMGLIKLRLGLEVCGNYLIISNLLWSQPFAIPRVEVAPLGGVRLETVPGAVEAQLAALFTAAQDQQRRAAMEGIGCLYPLTMGGTGDPAAAIEQHFRLLGFRPVHPAGGAWERRDGGLESTVYGRLHAARQPAYAAGRRDFGALRGLDRLSVSLQMEDGGLRTLCRWRYHRPSQP